MAEYEPDQKTIDVIVKRFGVDEDVAIAAARFALAMIWDKSTSSDWTGKEIVAKAVKLAQRRKADG